MAYLLVKKDTQGKEIIFIKDTLSLEDSIAVRCERAQLYWYSQGKFYVLKGEALCPQKY